QTGINRSISGGCGGYQVRKLSGAREARTALEQPAQKRHRTLDVAEGRARHQPHPARRKARTRERARGSERDERARAIEPPRACGIELGERLELFRRRDALAA